MDIVGDGRSCIATILQESFSYKTLLLRPSRSDTLQSIPLVLRDMSFTEMQSSTLRKSYQRTSSRASPRLSFLSTFGSATQSTNLPTSPRTKRDSRNSNFAEVSPSQRDHRASTSTLSEQDQFERRLLATMVENLDVPIPDLPDRSPPTAHNFRSESLSPHTRSPSLTNSEPEFNVDDYKGLRRRGSVQLSPMVFPDAIKDLYIFRN